MNLHHISSRRHARLVGLLIALTVLGSWQVVRHGGIPNQEDICHLAGGYWGYSTQKCHLR